MTLNKIYSRMGWGRGQQYNRRAKWHLLTFREAVLLAQACEAPVGKFLADLAAEWPKQTLEPDSLRRFGRRGFMVKRRCTNCRKINCPGGENCHKKVTAEGALVALKADRRARTRRR